MHKVPGRYNAPLYAILLTALARTMAPVIKSNHMLFELEGHGREEIAGTALDGVDLSRTIGWFTSIYPFYLDYNNQNTIGQQIAKVSAEVGRIPNRGIGFGILKYLHGDPMVREQLAVIPAPEINFNYLGQFDQSGVDLPDQPAGEAQPGLAAADGMPIRIIGEPAGLEQDPKSKRSPLLNVVDIISGGQLSVRWLYCQNVYKQERIAQLAENYLNELRLIINET
jgi:non-ribosomal peptide synthase protein (TIGR01720 family)